MKWDRFDRDEHDNRVYRVDSLHPSEPQQHRVVIPEEAIVDRMRLYELSTEEEAIRHIMYEHWVRLNPDKPIVDPQVKHNFDRTYDRNHSKRIREYPKVDPRG